MTYYRFYNIVNIESAKVKMYCKTTDLNCLYGVDDDGVCLTYNIVTAELTPADKEDWAYCSNGYDLNGDHFRDITGIDYSKDGLKDMHLRELPALMRIFLLGLVNPHVGGDELIKLFKLYGFTTNCKVKRSYVGSLRITDEEHNHLLTTRHLLESLEKDTE